MFTYKNDLPLEYLKILQKSYVLYQTNIPIIKIPLLSIVAHSSTTIPVFATHSLQKQPHYFNPKYTRMLTNKHTLKGEYCFLHRSVVTVTLMQMQHSRGQISHNIGMYVYMYIYLIQFSEFIMTFNKNQVVSKQMENCFY